MSATDERIDRMKILKREDFLDEASVLLDESYDDDDVTEHEHGQLFWAFCSKADEVLKEATPSENSQLNKIFTTRHAKSI